MSIDLRVDFTIVAEGEAPLSQFFRQINKWRLKQRKTQELIQVQSMKEEEEDDWEWEIKAKTTTTREMITMIIGCADIFDENNNQRKIIIIYIFFFFVKMILAPVLWPAEQYLAFCLGHHPTFFEVWVKWFHPERTFIKKDLRLFFFLWRLS